MYFSSLIIGPEFAPLSNCRTLQIGSISHSQAMPSNARGWRFRNLSPRILEARLHPFPLGHHHFLSPPRLQVPQVARPRSEGPRVSENNECLVSGQSRNGGGSSRGVRARRASLPLMGPGQSRRAAAWYSSLSCLNPPPFDLPCVYSLPDDLGNAYIHTVTLN